MRKTNQTVKATITVFTALFTTFLLRAQPQIAYQPVITSGLTEPIEVLTAPGDASGRLFIVQKGGTIRIWNGSSLLATPFLDISPISVDDGERGLLSMAFHPNYASNGFFFVYYNNNAGNVTVARYQVSADPNVANPAPNPASPLMSIPKPFDNHNGGHLQFRVEGGVNYLYFATGDGGSGNDPNNNAQNPASWLGKMIRMDVDAATPTPELWAWGLRNPFRWSFDRNTGDIWIGDVGQGLREEVDFRAGGTNGANYGWACFEGSLANGSAPGSADCDSVGNVDVLPIFQYDNPVSGSSSVVGGYVYRGTEFPSLTGWYMTADFYSGNVWLIQPNGSGGWNISAPQTGLPAFIASLHETDDGSAIYAASLAGNAVYKVVVPIVTPLTLVSFSGVAGNGYNDLAWVTANETGIDRFVIEYGFDGQQFSPAGELAAAAASRNYAWHHAPVNSEKVYYRLRILESDGRYTYSPVILLRAKGSDLQVYPSVVTGGSVQVNSTRAMELISLYSTDGKQLLQRNAGGQSGYIQVILPAVSPGMYFLQIGGKDWRETKKIIIQ